MEKLVITMATVIKSRGLHGREGQGAVGSQPGQGRQLGGRWSACRPLHTRAGNTFTLPSRVQAQTPRPSCVSPKVSLGSS